MSFCVISLGTAFIFTHAVHCTCAWLSCLCCHQDIKIIDDRLSPCLPRFSLLPSGVISSLAAVPPHSVLLSPPLHSPFLAALKTSLLPFDNYEVQWFFRSVHETWRWATLAVLCCIAVKPKLITRACCQHVRTFAAVNGATDEKLGFIQSWQNARINWKRVELNWAPCWFVTTVRRLQHDQDYCNSVRWTCSLAAFEDEICDLSQL